MTLQELVKIVGKEAVLVEHRNNWDICTFSKEGFADIRVHFHDEKAL